MSLHRNHSFQTTIIAALIVGALVMASPVQAQGFNPGAVLNEVTTRILAPVQRMYLRVIPGSKSGRAVLKQSLLANSNLRSFHYNMSADMTLLAAGQEISTGQLTAEGDVETDQLLDASQSRQQTSLSLSFDQAGESFSLASDVITDGDTATYFRLTELGFPSEADAPQLPDSLLNQWIKFEPEAMMMAMPEAAMEAEGQEETTDDETQELTPDQQRQLRQAILDAVESAEVSQATKENLDGDPVFVVTTTMDRDTLETLMVRMAEITDEAMTDQERQELADTLDRYQPVEATSWIHRDNFYLKRFEAPLTMQLDTDAAASQAGQELVGIQGEPDTIDVVVTVDLSNYNQPVEITIPQDAVSFQELMGEMMGGFMMGDDASQLFGNDSPTPGPGMMDDGAGRGSSAPGLPPGFDPADLPAEQRQLLEQYGY